MKRHLAILVLTVSIAGLAACGSSPPGSSRPAAAPNSVTDWASIIQPAIHRASEPRSPGTSLVLHTMAQLAVYDAVVAIEGGYEPYHSAIEAPKGADVRTAVATAAYRTARGRAAPSQLPYLDERYGAYLKDIPRARPRPMASRSVQPPRLASSIYAPTTASPTQPPTSAAPTRPRPVSSSPTAAAAPSQWRP